MRNQCLPKRLFIGGALSQPTDFMNGKAAGKKISGDRCTYRPDGGLLFMAGAWERSRIDDTLSFVILTTKANSFMSTSHRMPAPVKLPATNG